MRVGFSFEIHDNMFKNTFHSKIYVSPHATINKMLVPEIPVDYNSIPKSGFWSVYMKFNQTISSPCNKSLCV